MTEAATKMMEFIISAEDHNLACSVLQARFTTTDPQSLVTLIPGADPADPWLWNRIYELDDAAWRRIVAEFAIPFDTAGLEGRDITVSLWKRQWLSNVPYPVHTGYELLLLLNGQKKLARMGNEYPPMTFPGEETFERYVASGELHREEVIEPFEAPARNILGIRHIYYTCKGEEWRIPAMKLIWEAAFKSGGWNETCERLEGMLLGYEDWQNDWWADMQKRRGGSFLGIPFCGAVTAAGLAWIESAGFKALPPIDSLVLHSFDFEDNEQPARCVNTVPNAAAAIRFSVQPRYIAGIIDYNAGGPWHIPADKIPDLNRHIRGTIEILLQSKP